MKLWRITPPSLAIGKKAGKLFNSMQIRRTHMPLREHIFKLIDPPDDGQSNDSYDAFMIFTIIVSIVPLLFKETDENGILPIINVVTTVIFIVDYFLRWSVADYIQERQGKAAFALYPITPTALFDLLSILPGITQLNSALRLLKITRMIHILRVLKVFRGLRYSRNIDILTRVLRSQREMLLSLLSLALGYIFISAILLFHFKPDTFDSFFDALYWATISLATIGYGDIHPLTVVGKIITMISSIFGIAIIAMPAGVITAAFTRELGDSAEDDQGAGSTEEN